MKKVLIVEDDTIVAHIYRTRLEKEGYEVEIAVDGQSGFYRIHEFEPDAVLLDLMLPKMNGVEILKKIRAQAKFKTVPIIVFTNAYVANMINEAFVAGATLVFNKATLTPRQILDALHNAIHPSALAPNDQSGRPPARPDEGNPKRSENWSQENWSESSFHSAPPASVPAPAGLPAPSAPPFEQPVRTQTP